MKRLSKLAVTNITLIVIIVLAIATPAQEKKITRKDVPQAVLSAFAKSFPDARVRGYSTETEDGKTTFEIESHRGKMTLDAAYLSDGTVAEIEEGVTSGSLPEVVKAAVKSNFPKGKIAKAEKKTVGTAVIYEMKITTGKKSADVEIDPTGKIVKKAAEDAGKEEKEEKD